MRHTINGLERQVDYLPLRAVHRSALVNVLRVNDIRIDSQN